jgi:sugar phosphate permease
MFMKSRSLTSFFYAFQQRNRRDNIDQADAVKGGVTALSAELPEVAMRARRRIAARLLPFVFLMYVVNYIDRVNVSFANLRMSADLGFSDRVYGLGVGMFYLGYVLFEIPGAIIVERWSARKWIARIMISWGVLTILASCIAPHSSTLPDSSWVLQKPASSLE